MINENAPFTILLLGRIANTTLSAVAHELPEGKTYKDSIETPETPSLIPGWALGIDTEIPRNSIAYHPVFGAIVYNYSYYCFSTKEFIENLKAAEANPAIVAHLIHINSCGGEAFGCHEAYEAVKALTKPCYAVIDSMAASAGYYLACAADKIYASSLFSEVGCIGTMCTMINDEAWMKAHGYKELEYYSSYSPLKNKVFKDALEGEGDEFVKRFLDPLADQFIQDVRTVRPDVEEDSDALKGETYYAAVAQAVGLVDGVQSLEETISELAAESALKNEPSVNINNINFQQ
ncbi:MAG: S49 family peptidase [Bacteroidales bacterium]|nr:S49 family peptidase [Bacteroidales bacterium]